MLGECECVGREAGRYSKAQASNRGREALEFENRKASLFGLNTYISSRTSDRNIGGRMEGLNPEITIHIMQG